MSRPVRATARDLLGSASAVAILITVLLLAGASAPTASARHKTPTSASNRAAARADAATLLSTLALPAAAEPSATEPAGDHGLLATAQRAPATPNLVDTHAWWVVPGTTEGVLTYFQSHPPAGDVSFQPASPGVGPNDPPGTDQEAGFVWPTIRGVLSQRQLVLTVTNLGDGDIGVRADAEDVWISVRPVWERVPAGVRLITFTLRAPYGRSTPSIAQTIDARTQVARIIALVDRLGAQQPNGIDFGCTRADPDVTLEFLRAPGTRPLARLDDGACYDENFWIRGRRAPELVAAPGLISALRNQGLIPFCSAAQLSGLATAPTSSAGRSDATLIFENISDRGCTVGRSLRLTLLGADGHELRTSVESLGGRGLPTLILAPTESANVGVEWRYKGRGCDSEPASAIAVALSHVHEPIVVPVGSSRHPLSPCGGKLEIDGPIELP